MDSLYIVMPAYNEESNIEQVVNSWYPILEGKAAESRLVIDDFGSTDATHKILINLQKAKYPKLQIISSKNQFHGPKLIGLYQHAINNKIDYIFQTDSDGQTNPDEFNSFWDLRNKYEAIFGNRTSRQDGKTHVFAEKIVCILLRIYFGVNVPDANAPFRLMKTEVVSKYVSKMSQDYDLPNIMLTTYFAFFKEKITFKKISFSARLSGKSSMNLRKFFEIGFNALWDFRKFKKRMK